MLIGDATMKKLVKVDVHIKEKKKDYYLRELHELEIEKARIAKLIIRYRLEKGLTQGQLAKRIGVSQQQISKIENGEFSSMVTLVKVLLALGYFLNIRPVKLPERIASHLQIA